VKLVAHPTGVGPSGGDIGADFRPHADRQAAFSPSFPPSCARRRNFLYRIAGFLLSLPASEQPL